MTEVIEEGEFPHAPNNPTLIKQAEMWLKMHDIYDKACGLFKEWGSKMAHWNDRGPEDYDSDNKRDLESLLASAVREGARRASIEIQGGYHEGGGGDKQWKWIMPGLVTLAVTGIIGNVIQYAEVSSLKTAFTDFAASMERRVNNLEQRVYRGSP